MASGISRQKKSVWLIYYKKVANMPTVTYSEAVDEALCFGWIDSTVKSIDEKIFLQFFTKRKATSAWSKINKETAERLINEGLMADAGYSIIHVAKQNGSWTILDEAESLIIPNDLDDAFKKKANAKKYFLSLSSLINEIFCSGFFLLNVKRQEINELLKSQNLPISTRNQNNFAERITVY